MSGARTLAWAVAVSVGGMCLAGSAGNSAAERPFDELVFRLVSIAVNWEGDSSRTAAVKQLRPLAEEGKVPVAEMVMLASAGHDAGGAPRSYGRILAAGGPDVERILLLEAEVWDFTGPLEALGMSRKPSPQVTARLARLARDQGTKSGKRALCCLSLWARRDASGDWGSEVLKRLSPTQNKDSLAEQGDLVAGIACIGGGLPAGQALEEALLDLAARAPDRDFRWRVLLAFSVTARLPLEREMAQRLRALLPQPAEDMVWLDRILAHLIPARLRMDEELEVRRALTEVGRWSDDPTGSFESGLFLQYVVDVLVDDRLWGLVNASLSHESATVRTGAADLAAYMRYDAHGMRPALDKLVSDTAPRVAHAAARARVLVSGLGPDGRYVLQDELDRLAKKRMGWPFGEP